MLNYNIWKPIDSAPRDGSRILCWREGWDERGTFLTWRTNHRTKTTFWNDPIENDCYWLELEGPTHWLYVPDTPYSTENSTEDYYKKYRG